MKQFLFVGALLLVVTCGFGQVEHNYQMDPQVTDCHQLSLQNAALGKEVKIEKIEKAVFRVNQNLRINRPSGFQSAKYYSCDGKVGYLVLKVSGEYLLFYEVSKKDWDTFQIQSDFDGFIASHLKMNYFFE